MPPRKNYRPCDHCGRNRHVRFFSGPRAKNCKDCIKKKRSKSAHEQHVKKYGLLEGEYDKLLEAQGGCAICGQTRRTRLAVDHDHKTGLVRGLLCKLHNSRLLPAAKDNPEILQAAIDYLRDPPALRILGERYYQEKEK